MNTIVHAAFRRDLARFERALDAFAGGRSRAQALVTAWEWLADELHHHHDYEERLFWPALRQTDADVSSLEALEREHGRMRAALTDADEAMRALRADPSTDAAGRARSAVGGLSAVLAEHLEHEERDLEPISAAYEGAPGMRAAKKQVIKAQKGRLGAVLAWLQDGAADVEKRALRQQIPAPVVLVATAVGGRGYRRDIASVWASPAE